MKKSYEKPSLLKQGMLPGVTAGEPPLPKPISLLRG